MRSFHVSKPHVITVNKNPAYPIAIERLKKNMRLRQQKYLNNIEEAMQMIKKEQIDVRDRFAHNQKNQSLIVWTCNIRYDSVRSIYALFSYTFAKEP